MFDGAKSANPDMRTWDTSKVTTVRGMFNNANGAIGDISTWSLDVMEDMAYIKSSHWPVPVYERILINFAAQAQNLTNPISLGAGSSVYCSTEAINAHDYLVNTKGWDITDGGEDCSLQPPPISPNLTEASDSGLYSHDNFTNKPDLVYDVYCTYRNNVLTLYNGTTEVASRICPANEAIVSMAANDLIEGVHDFTYTEKIRNTTNKSEPSSILTVTVDLTPPAAPLQGTLQVAQDGALINTAQPEFIGQASDTDVKQILITQADEDLCQSNIINGDNDIFSYTAQVPLSEGDNTLGIVAMDLADNQSPPANHILNVNTNLDYGLAISSPNNPMLTHEDGSSETLTVSLNLTPIDDVTITISSSDPSEGNFNIELQTQTIRLENWNSSLQFELIGQDDDLVDGNQDYQVIFDLSASADPDYAELEPILNEAINIDDEASSDVSVDIVNCGTQVNPNSQVTYTLKVSNQGGEDVNQVMVNTTTWSGLNVDDWVCVEPANGSASCGSTSSGTDNLSGVEVSLESAATLIYTINATTIPTQGASATM